ncbi:MAG: hypothetical protein HW421_2214 [Ignavibacteria bacterium]|nr:hypothetical protein [Ignavibacteria bacterium]
MICKRQIECHSERSEESSPNAASGFFTSFRMTFHFYLLNINFQNIQIILLTSLTFIFYSCKENTSEPLKKANFSIEVTQSYLNNSGKVSFVLHSHDDKVKEIYKTLSSPGTIDFGYIETSKVTFSIIRELQYYKYIETFCNAPLGSVIFGDKSLIISNQGLLVDINFGVNKFDNIEISTPYVRMRNSLGNDSSTIFRYKLIGTESGKYSVFVSLYNSITDIAYCSWELDREIIPSLDTARFNINANIPMKPVQVQFSQPVNIVSLSAVRGQQNSFYSQSTISYTKKTTSTKLYYAKDFPAYSYVISSTYEDDIGGFYYHYWFDGSFPSTIIIPSELDVVASTKSDNLKSVIINNKTGKATYLNITYMATKSGKSTIWDVYTSPSITEFELPTLPETLINEYGLDITNLKPASISIKKYDNLNTFEDWFKAFYMSGKRNSMIRYNSSYEVYKWLR